MIPVWPTDLVQRVLQDGYSEAIPDGRIRQTMQRGPAKVRRGARTAVRPVSARIEVDYDGKARLERFVAEDLDGGVLPFWLPDQTGGGLPISTDGGLVLLTDGGGVLLTESWWLVRFAESLPSYAPAGGYGFVASFALEVLP